MAVERIDSIYDLSKIGPEHEQLSQWLISDQASITAFFDTIQKAGKGGGMAGVLADAKAYKAGLDNLNKTQSDLSLGVNAYQKILSSTSKIQAQSNALTSDAARVNADAKVALAEQNKELSQTAKLAAAVSESIGELKAQFAQLNTTRDNLQGGRSNPQYAELTAQAAALKAEIDASKEDINDFTGRVGNYTGAIDILKGGLSRVTAEIAKMTAAGQTNSSEFATLIKQESELNLLVNQQSAGFTSLAREVLTTGRQLQTMAEQGMQNTQEFKELNAVWIQNTKTLREFRNDQALLSSEAPKLQALTIAAKGLAGSYAVGQGAISLFGDESGKLSEKLNQLVAIQTVLQGLTELNDFFLKESAISTALFGEAATVTKDALSAQADALKEAGVATEVKTEVTEGAIVAEQGSTEAIIENTTALNVEKVAMEESAVATKGFAAALEFLEANPILIALTALAGVLLLVVHMMHSTEEELLAAIAAETGWADAINATTDAIKEQTNLTNENTEALKKNLEQKLAVAEKEGTSQANIFALRKKIIDQDEQEIKLQQKNQATQGINQDDITKRLNARLDQIKKLNLEQEKLAQAQLPENGSNNVIGADGSFFKQNEALRLGLMAGGNESGTTLISDKFADNKKELDAATADAKSLQKIHDDANTLKDRTDNNANEKELEAAEERKFNADERRKAILAEAELEESITKDANARILSDEKSSLVQRLAALKGNFNAELKLRQEQNRQIQNDPTKSDVEKHISFESLMSFGGGTDKKSASNPLGTGKTFSGTGRQDEKDAADKEARADLLARLDLQRQVNDAILNLDSQLQEEIYKNQSKGFADRTEALAKYNNDQSTLIQTAAAAEIEAKGLNDQIAVGADEKKQAELLAINTLTATKLKELAIKSAKEQTQIVVDSAAELTKESDRQSKTALSKKEAADFAKSKNNKQFDRQRKIDRDQTRNDELQSARYDQNVLANDKTLTPDARKTAKDNVDDLDNQIRDNNTQTEYDKRAELTAKQKKNEEETKQLTLDGIDVIQTAQDAAFDKRQKQLEKDAATVEKTEQRKQKQLSTSTLNAQQKAIEEQKIAEQAAAAKAIIDQKEKANAIAKAKFDRAAGIAKIVINTAVGATAAIPEGPEAVILAIAAGAVELAAVLAQPIPSYAKGTDNHPGGKARVFEAGPERVTLPDGKSFVGDKEAILDLPAGTKVTPLSRDEINEVMHFQMLQSMASNLTAIKPVQNKDTGITELKDAINSQTKQLANVFQRSQSTTNVIINTDFHNHITKNVRT